MAHIGYLRVSTQEQNLDRQRDALNDLCDEIFEEKTSAVASHRPVFEQVMQQLAPGDTLVVLSIDRAFRSTVDAVIHVEQLLARDVRFKIANLDIDTSTADGMFAFTIIAAVATHERMRISERTKQGLDAARKRGQRLGTPPKLERPALHSAAQRIARKETIKSVAESLHVAPWSLTRALKRHGLRA